MVQHAHQRVQKVSIIYLIMEVVINVLNLVQDAQDQVLKNVKVVMKDIILVNLPLV